MKILVQISCFLLFTIFNFSENQCQAQKYVTTVGIQFKPIIPSVFFRKDGFTSVENPVTVTVTPKNGTSFGMVIRRGLTNRFSFEGGINMVTRNYSILGTVADTSLTWNNEFKWLAYEIPLQLLVFIRLNDKIYLNAAGGMAFNFFPSDIQSENEDFYQRTYRFHWASLNLIANLGVEYRTESSGYFYLGASYLQPFSNMAQTQIRYRNTVPSTRVTNNLRGNYLTLDLRYFFHENPNSTTRKKLRDYKKKTKRA